jgi:hypothetical protein
VGKPVERVDRGVRCADRSCVDRDRTSLERYCLLCGVFAAETGELAEDGSNAEPAKHAENKQLAFAVFAISALNESLRPLVGRRRAGNNMVGEAHVMADRDASTATRQRSRYQVAQYGKAALRVGCVDVDGCSLDQRGICPRF